MNEGYDKHTHMHDGEIPCAEIARRVYAFIEGQADISELEAFREHIALCLPCRDLVQFEQKLIEVIKTKGGNGGTNRVPMPSSLSEKIKQVVALSTHPRPK